MKLYLLSAQMAFLCRCFGQAMASLNAAIKLMAECDDVNFVFLDFGPNLLSYLLLVPTEENLTLISQVVSICRKIEARKDFKNHFELGQFLIQMLNLLATASWTTYPYHIRKWD